MTRARIAIALCAVLVPGVGVAGISAAADRKLHSTLKGASEVPDKGDPDGSATATLTFKATKRQLCYVIVPKRLEKAAAAHIHTGAKGKAGGILVNLFTTPKAAKNGKISGCASNVSSATRQKLLARPAGFYLNIHTATYPSGSVRGQLSARH